MQKNPNQHYSCAVIGDWHLAFVTSACLASLGNRTLLVNPLTHENSKWEEFPELNLNEPGLPEMIKKARENNHFDYANGFAGGWTADIVWLAIDTPVNDKDEADVTPLLQAAEQVSRFNNVKGVFAISSQIPLGFCAEVEKRFGFKIAYIPENLRLGKGIETFLTADRTVIGANDSGTYDQIYKLLSGLTTEFYSCDLVTSEMVKHATNAFLASSISFANELARIGEMMGVDNQKVAQALKLDKRIGKQAYVAPGLGFAGGTLPRDLRILQKLGKKFKVPTPFVDAVLNVNESTAHALVHSISEYLGGLKGKKVLIMGYTYKADIDTLRRSASVELAEQLSQAGSQVSGFDPRMNSRDLSSLAGLLKHFDNWTDISDCPDAIMIMTARPEFEKMDWKALARKSSKTQDVLRPLVLDATAKMPSRAILDAGFSLKALWQPIQK